MSRISLTATIPQALDSKMTAFLSQHSSWSQDALVEAALEIFFTVQVPTPIRSVDTAVLEALDIEIESELYNRIGALGVDRSVVLERALQYWLEHQPSHREQLDLFSEAV